MAYRTSAQRAPRTGAGLRFAHAAHRLAPTHNSNEEQPAIVLLKAKKAG
ncbi:MAG: hypothetical protein ACRYG7_10205 [Janthinobacterium lividum]